MEADEQNLPLVHICSNAWTNSLPTLD
uniref:Uncharacterized protein n=1 Tax=Anguilla anguilla TaxID=7936 RepID=A0A0E9VYK5_ANGAN